MQKCIEDQIFIDHFITDAEIPPDERFKFYYVFKGPKKDGKNKRLHYVYGTSTKASDEGIKHEPYRPQGKGYNWPESYRKANNLYYELVFAEQGNGHRMVLYYQVFPV